LVQSHVPCVPYTVALATASSDRCFGMSDGFLWFAWGKDVEALHDRVRCR
jgi:hypothetical protein